MVSMLRMSLESVIIYGNEFASIALQEGAKRRRVQTIDRLNDLPEGGAVAFWQDIIGAPRDIEWQCLLGEAGEPDQGGRTWCTLTYEWSIACETIFNVISDWGAAEWQCQELNHRPSIEGDLLGWPDHAIKFFDESVIYQINLHSGTARPVRRVIINLGGGLIDGWQPLQVINTKDPVVAEGAGAAGMERGEVTEGMERGEDTEEPAAAAMEPMPMPRRVHMDMMPPRVEDLRQYIRETRHVRFANFFPDTFPDTLPEPEQANRATEGGGSSSHEIRNGRLR